MAVGGVVIVGEQAFGRACISMALAPFMSEVPILYSGPSIDEALRAAQRGTSVTAVLDLTTESRADIAAMVGGLTGIVCRIIAVVAYEDAYSDVMWASIGVDRVVSKHSSGIDDVVQAVFQRESQMQRNVVASVQLTYVQRRVLALFATGSSSREIGRELGISPETVKTHLKRVRANYRARGVHLSSRSDLYRIAVMSGTIV